jgi:hypothetical protein
LFEMAATAKSVMKAFTKDYQLVQKATTNDEVPTAGYLYNEINKITFKSNQDSLDLQDNLLNRLKVDSPAVKLKVLRVLKHVCTRGHASFKKDLQRRIDVLRVCLDFRGTPDPLYGDTPYRLVREEAQEVMNLCFDTEKNSQNDRTNETSASYNSSLTSMQSPDNSLNTNFAGYSGTSKKMDAIAGPYNDPPKSEKPSLATVGSAVSGAVSSAVSTVLVKIGYKGVTDNQVPLNSSADIGTYQRPQATYTPQNLERIQNNYALKSKPNAALWRHNENREAGQAGGNWKQIESTYITPSVNNDSETTSNTPIQKQNSAPQRSPSQTQISPAFGRPSKSSEADNQEYESKLVEEITAPLGGVRVVPSREVLNQFCTKCKTLNLEVICILLEKKLSSNAWQSRLKVLCIIEAALKAELYDIVDYFAQNSTSITDQLNSAQGSLKEKAAKLLEVIFAGREVEGDANEDQAQSPSGNLFEISNDNTNTNVLVPDENENLFGDLSVHTEEEPAEVKPSPISNTRNSSQQKRPTTTPAQQKRVQEPNLLDDIPAVVPQTSKLTSAAKQTSTSTSRTNQPAQKKEASLEDLLNSPSVKQTDNWSFENELDPLKNPPKEAEKPIKPTMKQQTSIYQQIPAQQGYYPYPPMMYAGYPQTYYPGAPPPSSIGIPITSIPMKSTTSYTTSLDAFNFTDNAKPTTVTPTTNNNNTATSAKKQTTDSSAFDFVKDAMRTQQNVSGKA